MVVRRSHERTQFENYIGGAGPHRRGDGCGLANDKTQPLAARWNVWRAWARISGPPPGFDRRAAGTGQRDSLQGKAHDPTTAAAARRDSAPVAAIRRGRNF